MDTTTLDIGESHKTSTSTLQVTETTETDEALRDEEETIKMDPTPIERLLMKTSPPTMTANPEHQ